MTPNLSFLLLDSAVIAGRAEDPFLVGSAPWTHARLLEEVAALGGVLRHLGVEPGVTVPVRMAGEHDLEAVVVALAVARIGGVVTREADPAAPVVVTSASEPAPAAVEVSGADDGVGGQVRLVRAAPGEQAAEPDLDWGVMLRAGRTDPAAAAVLDPGSAYAPGTTLAAQLEAVAATRAPYVPAELRRLLQV